jgi:hypothetical protein
MKHRLKGEGESPYIAPRYVNEILPGDMDAMRSFFHFERVKDPAQAMRIFTLEYLLRRLGSKVRIEA